MNTVEFIQLKKVCYEGTIQSEAIPKLSQKDKEPAQERERERERERIGKGSAKPFTFS
jgi:hypothetical protein